MKRKIDEISIEEIKNAFSICNNNTEVMKMFGYKDNGSGQRFVKKLRIKGGALNSVNILTTQPENITNSNQKNVYYVGK